MATDPIDRISVEIETSSTVAENGVSALVRSLESLNSVLNKIADTGAVKALKNVGKTAQKASAETNVQARQSVLSRATRTVRESPTAKRQEQIRRSARYSRIPNAAAKKEWAQTVRYLQGNGPKPEFDIKPKVDLSELKKSIKEAEKSLPGLDKKITDLFGKYKSIQGENIIGKNAESAVKSAEQKMEQLSFAAQAARDSAGKLSETLAKIKDKKIELPQSDIDSLIDKYRIASAAAIELGTETENAMKTAKEEIAQAQAKADEMKQSLFSHGTAWSALKSAATNALDEVKTKIAEAASQSKLLAGALKVAIPVIGTIVSVFRGALSLVGKLLSGFKRLASTIAGSLVSAVKKFASLVKSIGGHVLNYVTKPFRKAIGVIEKWKSKILSVAFYRAVRSAMKIVTDGFKEGYENYKAWSDAVNNDFSVSMSKLSSSAQYLKNSLGALAGPLVNAIAPAVEYLINEFVKLIEVINMALSLLSGKGTYTRAVRGTAASVVSLNKSMSQVQVATVAASDAMESTNASTTKTGTAMERIAVHSASAQDAIEGVSVASTTAMEAMSGISLASATVNESLENTAYSADLLKDKVSAMDDASKAAEVIDKSIDNAADSAKVLHGWLIGIDELTIMPEETQGGGGGGGGGGIDVGGMFEEAPMPDWAQTLKDAIDAGKWYEAGELLAEKVNGLIEKLQENAPTWGNKIGQAIQNGIDFSLGFIRNLNIEGLGQSVATIIGNALNNINPQNLGALLASGIKSVFRFAHGFLQGYTGPEIGTYLANVVNGWFAELRRGGGWEKAGQDLNNAILSIIDGVKNFIEGLDTSSIAADLKAFFGQIKWVEIWESVKSLAQTAANKVDWQGILDSLWRFAANVLVFLREEILGIPSGQASQAWEELEGKLADANERINWADIISGLIAFVGDIVSTIKDALPDTGWDGFWSEVKESVANALGFDGWDDLKGQFSDKIYGVISAAFDTALDSIFNYLMGKGFIGELAAQTFFPEKWQINASTKNLITELENGYTDVAQKQIAAMIANGQITNAEAEAIAAQYGYSFKDGILSSIPEVESAAEEVVNGVDRGLGNGMGGGGRFGNVEALKRMPRDLAREIRNGRPEVEGASAEIVQGINDTLGDVETGVTIEVDGTTTSGFNEVKTLYDSFEDKHPRIEASASVNVEKGKGTTKKVWDFLTGGYVDVEADITAVNDKVPDAQKDFEVRGVFTKTDKSKLTTSDKDINTRSVYTDVKDNLTTDEKSFSVRAIFKDRTDSLTTDQKTFVSFADFTGIKDSLSAAQKTFGVTANFNARNDALSDTQKTFETNANFTTSNNGLGTPSFNSKANFTTSSNSLGTPSFNSKANFSSYSNNLGTPSLNAKANVNNWTNNVGTISLKATAYVNKYVRGGNNSVRLATGGIFAGGKWKPIQGYASGGAPKRSRLFYANENGIPELVGQIGNNTAVMNNGQIVASVSSGVYRAVAAAMGGVGTYFSNIASGMSRIPDALRSITPVQPQPIRVNQDQSIYQQMEAGGFNRARYDGVDYRDHEGTENLISAIYAMGQQIVTAINENGGDFYLDGQMVGTRTTEVQNRQSRMYGKAMASA